MLRHIIGICLVLLIIAIRTYQQDDFAWIDMNVPKTNHNHNLRAPKQEDTPPSLKLIDKGSPKKEEVSTPPTPPSLRGSGTIKNNRNQGQRTLFKFDFGQDVRRSNRRRTSLFTIDVGTDLREVSPGIEEHFKRKDAERAAYLQKVGDEIFWNWITLTSGGVVLLSFLLVILQLVIIKAPIKTEVKCRIVLQIICNYFTCKALGIIPDMWLMGGLLGGVITSNIYEFRRWVTR